jgi:phenylpropionate dioxygenase-like ring-hydroxylating dioxygenase large terminal subunit
MRLSLGRVVGENLRCGLHFMQFDGAGLCASVPEAMKTDEDYKKSCSAVRFFVRESRGLVWLSADDDPDLFFPAALLGKEGSLAEGWFLEVKGDTQAWLDHFLDYIHVPYTHYYSTFKGMRDDQLGMTHEPPPRNGGGYPIEYGSFKIAHGFRRSPLMNLAQAGGFWKFASQLVPRKDSAPNEIQIDVTMHTPVCHEFKLTYRSRFGTKVADFVNFVNPISADRLIFSDLVTIHPQDFWPWSWLQSAIVKKVARIEHVIHEDEPYFSTASTTDLAQMRLTPVDDLLVKGRGAFAEYARRKGRLFPASSYFHRFAAGSPPSAL